MSKRANSDSVFSPELLRIIKIFGAFSVGLVLVLSFFNERRADNTGKDRTFEMTSASRLYFQNVKAIQYDRELRRDAEMTIYRHKKSRLEDDKTSVILMIILNIQRDEAYIYLEPKGIDWPLEFKLKSDDQSTEVMFQNGNKSDHLNMFRTLEAYIGADASIQLKTESGWIPIWETPKEREALNSILEDYRKLTE
jgi:hypothetical protein